MAGLGMGKAEIAVSQKGIKNLISKIETNSKTAKKKVGVKASDFTNLKKVITDYWKGADADNFIADLQTATTVIENLSDNIYKQLSTALNDYYNAFIRMQNQNYSKGSTKIG